MKLIQNLPAGALDIIGDIHGEFQALCDLLQHLHYDHNGKHPEDRHLVFVGDFCDRGPDSPAVLNLVQHMITLGNASAILGNHEINLLRDDAKDGSGWFFDQRQEHDAPKYAPYQRASIDEKIRIKQFLRTLPLALERDDLRIVHAAWHAEAIALLRHLSTHELTDHYHHWDTKAQSAARQLQDAIQDELTTWPHGLENKQQTPPMLHAHAEHDSLRQMRNPIRVVSSGIERKAHAPFYSSGKWRFAERMQWWNEYDDATPVVIGHYWRRATPMDRNAIGKGDPDLFNDTISHHWHGKRGNVFCVDFSVGGRWSARKTNAPLQQDCKLAALRWPERTLCFDDGSELATEGFMSNKKVN